MGKRMYGIQRADQPGGLWSVERANEWFAATGWKMGCTFIPSTAVNQLEMWQAETFDPDTIDRELGWAAGLGMNVARVYLHDLAWHTDAAGLKDRFERYLSIADAHGIATIPVLLDDCWFPGAVAGPQPEPVPGIHNSRWLQSPGVAAAQDSEQEPRLKGYVQDICGSFSRDSRILMWDVYNEVGNFFLPVMGRTWFRRLGPLARQLIGLYVLPVATVPLLLKAFAWIREIAPEQPLTVCTWFNHRRLNEICLSLSDVISFHNYEPAEKLRAQITRLETIGRPLICTEYMARPAGSTFEDCLPVFHECGVSCLNWGLVAGKTQTIYSWKDHGSTAEPDPWFHDILRPDGSPWSEAEVELIRRLAPP